MKSIAFLFVALSLVGFKKKEVAAVQQSSSILCADVICLGKMTAIDSTGFWISVEKEIANDTPNKDLFQSKKLFVSYKTPANTGYRNYGTQMPTKDLPYIFTLKYDAKNNKIIPFYYAVGIPVDTKVTIGCYATGSTKYEKVTLNEFIKGIILLRKCYPKVSVYQHELLNSKLSNVEILKLKNTNLALKIWVEEIEQRNEYYKNIKK